MTLIPVRLLEREPELAEVEALLQRRAGILLIEGGAGLGKTSLVEVACRRAEELGYGVLRARGTELEVEFAFGVVRQLFERRLADAEPSEREALVAGPAAAVRPLLLGGVAAASDRSFAVLHGLYWLASNLAASAPLLVAVDDAHWADTPSLRWLAYLALRVEGLALPLVVALRPGERAATSPSLLALRNEASVVVRPALLSESAVATFVRANLGDRAASELCEAVWTASGGNPLYVTELLRAVDLDEGSSGDAATRLVAGRGAIARGVVARVHRLGPSALALAQAFAVLGDGCELHTAAAIAGVEPLEAARLAAGLVQLEVLSADRPVQFIHPVVRDALEASLDSDAWGTRPTVPLRGCFTARERRPDGLCSCTSWG